MNWKWNDEVLTITLDRLKANATNVATNQLLHVVLRRLRMVSELRVAMINGSGRFFAGWGLNAAVEGEPIDTNHGLDKPMLVSVNALAMGGGFEPHRLWLPRRCRWPRSSRYCLLPRRKHWKTHSGPCAVAAGQRTPPCCIRSMPPSVSCPRRLARTPT